MTHSIPCPKRLIEVDLPIKAISAHARREKSIRHGHISTLHIWWARRPLAACRAVLCAALWPDPLDDNCPQAFRDAAAAALRDFAEKARSHAKLAELCQVGWSRWNRTTHASLRGDDPQCWSEIRCALLDFIADFANWDASTVPAFLATARGLTQAAHEALGGIPGTRPLVVDPFAGGGAIPLEALRIGADAFASDINPVAVLLNKVVLEYIPRYGQRLADEVRKWGQWIKEQAENELGQFYPEDPDGATPIAYLWARTIVCEGPGCGTEVPLMRTLWLAKRKGCYQALRWVRDGQAQVRTQAVAVPYANGETRTVQQPVLDIWEPHKVEVVHEGTVHRGSATCPVCGYTTPVEAVRRQLRARRGGTTDARLLAVVTTRPGKKGRFYRLPTENDGQAVRLAGKELSRQQARHEGPLSLVPDETISLNEIRRISVPIYGMTTWGDLFTPRQALALTVLSRLVRRSAEHMAPQCNAGLTSAVQTCLALAVDKQIDFNSSLSRWANHMEKSVATFSRQALPMLWDWGEVCPLGKSTGSFQVGLHWIIRALETTAEGLGQSVTGTVAIASASSYLLPNDATPCFFTDPPYYDAVPYAHLSDFFYVWLRRMLGHVHPSIFNTDQVPKDEEIVVDRPHRLSDSQKDIAFYERELTKAFSEGRRVLRPEGIGLIVFASKTTASWEAILHAVLKAGWVITGSWPVDTERQARVAAQGQARLASSIHIACRPRENPDGSLDNTSIAEWRGVLDILPPRIRHWMPRLAQEGVVGADAVFACLGPALEIYSRYSRVERADGTTVPLGDVLDENGRVVERGYLSYVWEAVSKEALQMVFEGADTAGFEADARLTAMWLWTLSTGENGTNSGVGSDEPIASTGYTLEYDAARKIAQGLGAHLEQMTSLVQIKGDKARLLPVTERTKALFGKGAPSTREQRGQAAQLLLFAEMETAQEESTPEGLGIPAPGSTTLDRVHQAMLLFATGRSDALRRLLVDEGVGREARFWRLAQALSALYPVRTDEKRWVDSVLARKKGLGL